MNNDLTAELNDKHGQQDKPLDSHDLLLNALLMLLSDLCLTRFQLLMAAEQDPSEAAKEVIESLDRYDFLSKLEVANTSYLELKKQIENDIGNEAEKVIRRENPR